MSNEALGTPDFIARDAGAITTEMIEAYEAATGRVLQPAQVERVLIDIFAQREMLIRIATQEVGLQNLVAFAGFPALDFLGEIVGALRLPAAAATATLRFTLSGSQSAAVVVPAGTRVRTTDGAVVFSTDQELSIAAASVTGDVAATALDAGKIGNGYAAGTVTGILDPVPLVASASNLATTTGGVEVETDDAFRARIQQAPNQFSVAGSAAAYRYHALSVDPSITDVSVTSPESGTVRVYLLTASGPPGAGLIAEVAAALSAEDVRPLTDTVEVVAPTEVEYEIEATVRPLAGADAAAVIAAAEAAAEAYAADRSAGLGRDLVPSQIIAALSVDGVYDVTLTSPESTELDADEWANCTDITITQGTTADG